MAGYGQPALTTAPKPMMGPGNASPLGNGLQANPQGRVPLPGQVQSQPVGTPTPIQVPGRQGQIGTAITATPQDRLAALNPAQRAAFTTWIAAQHPGSAAPTSPLQAGLQYATAVRNGQAALPYGVTHLPASYEASMLAAQQGINQNTRAQLAQNAYSQGQSALQYVPQFANEAQQFQQSVTNEPGQFVARGILGSGIENQQLQNMYRQHLQNVGQLSQNREGSLAGYDLAHQQILSARNAALQQLQVQHQQALAQYATQNQQYGLRGTSGAQAAAPKLPKVKVSRSRKVK